MMATIIADRISAIELEDELGSRRFIRSSKNEKFTISEKRAILKPKEKDKIFN